MKQDTIFALSSGAPPAAIGVIRISGPDAMTAGEALAGALPPARQASLRTLRNASGEALDQALVVCFSGPYSATGEDCVELHCHGGLAVVNAVQAALADLPELRAAQAGEFTRRAFANGRLDLAEAEGLADLLSAETELQRKAAIGMAGGRLSRQVEVWRDHLLALSGMVEAVLDFGDEDDVGELSPAFADGLASLVNDLSQWLERPSVDKLREGFRVVLAGPPNSGKSTLFNALLNDEAAIVSPQAGTTRDVIERPVAIGGVPFTLIDVAGLREATSDSIEEIGIARARREVELADFVLWLGEEGGGPSPASTLVWEIDAKIDLEEASRKSCPRHRVSAVTADGIDGLLEDLADEARKRIGPVSKGSLNARQRELINEAFESLRQAFSERDHLIKAEFLRQARIAFDRLIGRATTEDMLDALFGRFCIGK